MSSTAALDRAFEPFRRCLTPAVARKIVKFRADSELKARVQELADKANDGLLTHSERSEYEGYVRAIDLIAILQAKARRYLADTRK
jgi:predicted transcriptional regulator